MRRLKTLIFLSLVPLFLGCDIWKNPDAQSGGGFSPNTSGVVYDVNGQVVGRLSPDSLYYYFVTLPDGAVLALDLVTGTILGGPVQSKSTPIDMNACFFTSKDCSGPCYVGLNGTTPLNQAVFANANGELFIYRPIQRESVKVYSTVSLGLCQAIDVLNQGLYPVQTPYALKVYPFPHPLYCSF